jgi:hypothetical protein
MHCVTMLTCHAGRCMAGTKLAKRHCSFVPAQVEISMDALETAKWECYMQPFYRDLPIIRGIGRTLYYYAQHFSCMHAGAKRQVYHNIPHGSGGLSCS